MSFSSIRRLSVGLLGCSLLALGGCSESVTQHDVEQARQKAEHEHQESMKVRTQSPDDPKAIQKQDQITAEADQKLTTTEEKAQATSDRDAFAARVEDQLKAADQRIADLKKTASNQTGVQKQDTQRKIDDLQSRRDRVQDNLSKLKSADLLQWDTYESAVRQSLDALNRT